MLQLSRFFIALVILSNLQAAVIFWLWPGSFLSSYELSGVPGEAALRGMGILFLMWNIPYMVALWNPLRHRLSLHEAIAMQAVGLIGESILLLGLPNGYDALRSSIQRFIWFDGAGLLLLCAARLLAR